jgi:hypothetical protein
MPAAISNPAKPSAGALSQIGALLPEMRPSP